MSFTERWKWKLEDFLTRNSGPVLMLATLFVVGVIFGALAIRSLENRDKLELVSYLSSAMPILKSPPSHSGAVLLKSAVLSKFKLLAFMWILGISLLGAFGAMVIAFLRGFMSGFVVAFLASELGGPGVLLVMAGHLPQSLLEVPAILLAASAAVSFSMQVVRSWRERRRVPHFYSAIATYTGILAFAGAMLLMASVLESFVSPALIRLSVSFLRPA